MIMPKAAKAQGRPIVGIMCEFTPREIILPRRRAGSAFAVVPAATIPEAEQYLPANLCPLIKSTFGSHVKGSRSIFAMVEFGGCRDDLRRKKKSSS